MKLHGCQEAVPTLKGAVMTLQELNAFSKWRF